MVHNNIKKGVKDGIPIGIGYFSVSFTFGMLAVKDGISPFHAVLISLLNLTSAGQFAGLNVIVSGASLWDMALTQLVVNIRYALMSLSLSQKLDASVSLANRMLIAYGNTDEIFAVASSSGDCGKMVYVWTYAASGHRLERRNPAGAVAGTLLPADIISASGIALYGMFIAIVVPVAKEHREIAVVTVTALILSTTFYYLPVLKEISSGFSMILCTILAAGLGAVLFPVKEEEK